MATSDLITLETLTGDPVVEEARKQFNRCAEWESTWRKKFIDDLKFSNADSENGYQWPDDIRRTRDLNDRPCLTLNLLHQHNLIISNTARQNKQSVRVLGVGNGATQESANMVKNLIRHVERISHAQHNCYTPARNFQISGGLGWWRIITDYESNDSFDQEIFIIPVADPLSVYMDPDIQNSDGSDAKFAFVFDFLPDDQIRKLVPDWTSDGPPKTPMGIAMGESFWIEKDHTMVAEWFRKVPKKDQLVSFVVRGERKVIRASKMPENLKDRIFDDPQTLVRDIIDQKVEWNLLVGEKIVDTIEWPGKYIPLIRCVGEEYVIEGIMDRKGHTRSMADAQRMYNYNASGQVEFGALQSKTPWLAAAKAIEEHEVMWNSANTENHAVLVWNHLDAESGADVPIPPPQRIDPPQLSPLFEQGMATAMNQMMMVSGQYPNQLGMEGNERTGAAIQKRQDQGDTATFHFQDNYAEALKFTYRQIIDLFPHVYDTKRVKHIEADDGQDMEVVLDPGAQQAFLQELNQNNEVAKRIFNPMLGRYEIAEDVGPAVATSREDTVEALTLVLTQAPGLTGIIGDILLRNMPFEDAQEAALRLKRMVPQQALGEGPTQSEQQLQQQVGQLTTTLAKAMQRHGKDALKLVGKDQMRDIDVYKAETDRIKAITAKEMDSSSLQEMVHQLVGDALATHLTPILEANLTGSADQSSGGTGTEDPTPDGAPIAGAQKAPDGQWYLADPTRKGRYLKIAPLAQERGGRV